MIKPLHAVLAFKGDLIFCKYFFLFTKPLSHNAASHLWGSGATAGFDIMGFPSRLSWICPHSHWGLAIIMDISHTLIFDCVTYGGVDNGYLWDGL